MDKRFVRFICATKQQRPATPAPEITPPVREQLQHQRVRLTASYVNKARAASHLHPLPPPPPDTQCPAAAACQSRSARARSTSLAQNVRFPQEYVHVRRHARAAHIHAADEVHVHACSLAAHVLSHKRCKIRGHGLIGKLDAGRRRGGM